jgi:copper(I)-binding protein
MLRERSRQPGEESARRRLLSRRWQVAACAAALLVAGLTAGCSAPAQAGPLIKLSSAQITVPNSGGITDVYVDVQNNGPADRLISAKVSSGGAVALRSPIRASVLEMRTVRSITIPADSLIRLDPNGSHLLVTGSGRMIAGREITLTLIFAHAGAISVPAMVTNPESGGSSYFLN